MKGELRILLYAEYLISLVSGVSSPLLPAIWQNFSNIFSFFSVLPNFLLLSTGGGLRKEGEVKEGEKTNFSLQLCLSLLNHNPAVVISIRNFFMQKKLKLKLSRVRWRFYVYDIKCFVIFHNSYYCAL